MLTENKKKELADSMKHIKALKALNNQDETHKMMLRIMRDNVRKVMKGA